MTTSKIAEIVEMTRTGKFSFDGTRNELETQYVAAVMMADIEKEHPLRWLLIASLLEQMLEQQYRQLDDFSGQQLRILHARGCALARLYRDHCDTEEMIQGVLPVA